MKMINLTMRPIQSSQRKMVTTRALLASFKASRDGSVVNDLCKRVAPGAGRPEHLEASTHVGRRLLGELAIAASELLALPIARCALQQTLEPELDAHLLQERALRHRAPCANCIRAKPKSIKFNVMSVT